MAAVKFSKRQV